ncbi:MAG: hypothetical protein GXO47_06690 [Chlorobi bacterium]|nr:hypothetical protein [Chlorobiota bacterium]
MIKIFSLTFILIFSGLSGGLAQKHIPSSRPKMVLFLMLDELSSEQLFIIRDKLSDGGFNKLISGGAYFRSAEYPSGSHFDGTYVSTLYTGSYPSTHGIISDKWFEQFKDKSIYAISDDTGRISAKKILASGIADELRRVYGDSAKIAAVGFSPGKLIWSLGNDVTNAFWFDKKTGDFISPRDTSVHKLPDWINEFNGKNIADMYSERQWGPLLDITEYHKFTFFRNQLKDNYTFLFELDKSKGKEPYAPVAGSPFGNKLVRDFAQSLIVNEKFGNDNIPDILTINFITSSPLSSGNDHFDPVDEDLLLRLDLEIKGLLKYIDKEIGLENVLIVTSGITTPGKYVSSQQKYDKGIFNGKKAAALLNLYLMAIHGQGKWVKTYYDGQFYMNHDLLEKSNLSINKIEQEAAAFLEQISGIAYALPASDVIAASMNLPAMQNLKLIYHPKRSGDILIALAPGWREELPDGRLVSRKWVEERVPLIFYGWKITRQLHNEPVEMTDVAPSICSFLQISYPNGCEGKALPDLTR